MQKKVYNISFLGQYNLVRWLCLLRHFEVLEIFYSFYIESFKAVRS